LMVDAWQETIIKIIPSRLFGVGRQNRKRVDVKAESRSSPFSFCALSLEVRS
jgi:hypothetical protein